MNFQPRRHDMWKKIEEAQARNARRLSRSAAATRSSIVGVAKQHPLKLIGGAVVLGAIAALIIPKRNRKILGRNYAAAAALATRIITDFERNSRAALSTASKWHNKTHYSEAVSKRRGLGNWRHRWARQE